MECDGTTVVGQSFGKSFEIMYFYIKPTKFYVKFNIITAELTFQPLYNAI